MKDIVIIANFIGAIDGGKNSRFSYLAGLLHENNFKVEIISSSFSHDNKIQRDKINMEFRYKISLIKEPGYKKNISLKRFYSHYIWGKNVLNFVSDREKPELVYCAVPSLTAAYKVGKYCKKNNIKYIIDIQDLWPEAFQMVLKNKLLGRVLFFPFNLIANRIYGMADVIFAVSNSYVERAKKCNQSGQGYSVFLGTNLDEFDKYANNKCLLEKSDDELWIAYCGTLGNSYDIKCVINAIKETGIANNKLKFIVMGDGPKKFEFEQFAKEKGINSLFLGSLPYSEMCSVLCKCDMTVNPIVGKSAASIINKHADYAACALPVLNTQESKEYMELVDKYKMGFNIENGNYHMLAEKIKFLVENKDLRNEYGKNSRKCAEKLFDRKHSYMIIKNVLEKI